MEEEYNFIGGKKKGKFKFANAESFIGYSKTKIIKINCNKTELKIAEIIMNNPNKNLVNIYSVDKKKKEIIMERFASKDPKKGVEGYLISPKQSELKKYLKDVEASLKQLNKLNIAYLDLKSHNIGYSKKDKVWKIFDFDFSAIYNNNKWIIKPKYVQPLRAIKLAKIKLKPHEIDSYLFKYFKKQLKKNILSSGYLYLDYIKPNFNNIQFQKIIDITAKKKSAKKRKSKKSRKSRKNRKSSKKTSRKSIKSSCKGLKRKSCLKKSKKCSWRSKSKRAKAYCAQKPKFSKK